MVAGHISLFRPVFYMSQLILKKGAIIFVLQDPVE